MKRSPYVVTSDDDESSDKSYCSPPHSPLLPTIKISSSPSSKSSSSPPLNTKDSIILSRLTLASSNDNDAQGRKKIACLLARHGNTAAEYNDSESAGVTPLMQAAIKGNIECCVELIKAGADANSTTNYGWSSVHFAAALGKDRCLSAIISASKLADKNVEPDLQDESGYSPLHLAAMGGHTACLDILVKNGHSLKVRSNEQATPLHLAAQEGRLFTIHRLCKLFVPVDEIDLGGWTAISIAAREGNKNIAQVLIDSGANVNYISRQGISPFSVACENNRFEIGKTLLAAGAIVRPCDLVTVSDAGYSKFLSEIIKNVDVVKDSELKGIKIRTAIGNKSQQIPRLSLSPALHAAINKGQVTCCEVLLAAGAEIHSMIGNIDGLQPLHRAIKKNCSLEMIVLLLNYGADPLAVTKNSKISTPILLAAERGRLGIIQKLLLKTFKCLNGIDKERETCLMKAVIANDLTVCKYILSSSIGSCSKLPKMINIRGNTALHIAARLGRIECAKEMLKDSRVVGLINNANKNKMTALHLACKAGYMNVVRLLVDNRASLNLCDNKGASPLLVAVEAGAEDLVSLLLSSGASPTTAKSSGATGFHAAARRGHTNIISLLLSSINRKKYKSSVKSVMNSKMKRCGSTSLILSVKMGHIEAMVKLLECCAIEIDAMNADGDTALMFATKLGDCSMCRKLIEHGADSRFRCGGQGSPIAWAQRQKDSLLVDILLWKPEIKEEEEKAEVEVEEVEKGRENGCILM